MNDWLRPRWGIKWGRLYIGKYIVITEMLRWTFRFMIYERKPHPTSNGFIAGFFTDYCRYSPRYKNRFDIIWFWRTPEGGRGRGLKKVY